MSLANLSITGRICINFSTFINCKKVGITPFYKGYQFHIKKRRENINASVANDIRDTNLKSNNDNKHKTLRHAIKN